MVGYSTPTCVEIAELHELVCHNITPATGNYALQQL